MNRQEKWPILYRTMDAKLTPVARGEGEEEEEDPAVRVYDVAISSETPVTRWFGKEILSHAKGAVDMQRLRNNAALLWNHDRYDQIGAVKEARLDEDKVLRGRVRFARSARGQEFRQGVDDEIYTQVSVGYQVLKAKRTKVGDPEAGEIDEWTISRWMPHEVSLVSIAADISVGVGRNADGERFPVEIDGEPVEEERMKNGEGEAGAATVETPPIEVRSERGEVGPGKGGEMNAREAIIAIGTHYGIPEAKTLEALRSGVTVEEFKTVALDHLRTTGKVVSASDLTSGVPARELRKYRYARAILGAVDVAQGRAKMFTGLEREVHEEIENKMPDGIARRGGIHIPLALDPNTYDRIALSHMMGSRAYPLDSATTGEGKEGIFVVQGELIETLRNRLVVGAMGARMLPGLVGPVTFPRQTASGTFVWYVEEAAAIADSMLTLDTVAMVPKTGMSSTGYTRQLLAQESIGIEALVRDDLAAIHALGIDQAALIGSAAAGQPRGIALTAGVGVVDFGAGAGANAAPSFAKLVDMQGVVADANADNGALGYVITPLCAATCRKTLEFAAAGAMAIWQGTFEDGRVAGYRARASNQAGKLWLNGAPTGGAEHGLFYGNWNELLIGMWGAMELVVDPYTLKKRAIIEVTSFQLWDVALRHAASFCYGSNVIP